MNFPRWLSWMFVLVLVYMVYAARSVEAPEGNAKPMIQPITEETSPVLTETMDLERWKRALNPDYAAVMNCTIDKPKSKTAPPLIITQEAQGVGVGVACGEKVKLELTLWDAKGTQKFSGTVTLALGARDLASGLDKGLLGLKPGGVRLLTLPAYARAHAKSKPAQATLVTLRKDMEGESLVVVRAKRL